MFINGTYPYFWGRSVRVRDAEAGGGRVAVPVEIDAFGDEAAIGFTLEYDQDKFTDPEVKLGQEVADGAVLTVNDDGLGRIAILIDSASSTTSPGGSKRVVTITFSVAPRAKGDSTLAITNSLAERSIADLNGNLVATRWVNGRILINAE